MNMPKFDFSDCMVGGGCEAPAWEEVKLTLPRQSYPRLYTHCGTGLPKERFMDLAHHGWVIMIGRQKFGVVDDRGTTLPEQKR